MPCSAVTLSLATISAIIAVALLAIAFSTDNWLYIEVKRGKIEFWFLLFSLRDRVVRKERESAQTERNPELLSQEVFSVDLAA
ncbi:hypothetical protein RUM44_010941 [Polyplax serrata]|uniref:Uncharacterized protein n=1 Tax=Polyplax serrata TaxID=468196 RepID=A0ABR1ANL3_POLSC